MFKTIFSLAIIIALASSRTITIQNNCGNGIKVFSNSNPGWSNPTDGTWLNSGSSAQIYPADNWQGNVLADNQGTWAEFCLHCFEGKDNYDVSTQAGWDYSMAIYPRDGSCQPLNCKYRGASDCWPANPSCSSNPDYTIVWCS